MIEWMKEWMSEWMDERMDKWMYYVQVQGVSSVCASTLKTTSYSIFVFK